MSKKSGSALRTNILFFFEVSGVVAIWRGLWLLMDIYLFPSHPEISAIVGIVVGVVTLLFDDRLISEVSNRVR